MTHLRMGLSDWKGLLHLQTPERFGCFDREHAHLFLLKDASWQAMTNAVSCASWQRLPQLEGPIGEALAMKLQRSCRSAAI